MTQSPSVSARSLRGAGSGEREAGRGIRRESTARFLWPVQWLCSDCVVVLEPVRALKFIDLHPQKRSVFLPDHL